MQIRAVDTPPSRAHLDQRFFPLLLFHLFSFLVCSFPISFLCNSSFCYVTIPLLLPPKASALMHLPRRQASKASDSYFALAKFVAHQGPPLFYKQGPRRQIGGPPSLFSFPPVAAKTAPLFKPSTSSTQLLPAAAPAASSTAAIAGAVPASVATRASIVVLVAASASASSLASRAGEAARWACYRRSLP